MLLAYHNPGQLAVLLSALRHPQVTVYLHIDSGADIRPFRSALAEARIGDVVLMHRHRSSWGSLAIVDAELDGTARALADGCSYVTLISGEDFPLRPVADIVGFFEEHRDRCFVEAFALADGPWPLQGRERTDFYTCRLGRKRFTCVPHGEDTSWMKHRRRLVNWALRARFVLEPPRRFPAYVRARGGSQWLNLTASAATQILEFVERHPDYHRYHRHTACPDELYAQSILLGTSLAQANEIVDDDLRFLIWVGGGGEHPIAHPETLTLDHLPAMLASRDLFARKVSAQEQPELFAELCERISQAARP